MAFRRASFSRPFRRPFRRRRGVRQITEPKRWEAANFAFPWTINVLPEGQNGVGLDLLSQAHFDDFGLTPEVRALADAIRTVQIGGIVWDTVFYSFAFGETGQTGQVLPVQEILWTDRVNVNGAPITGTSPAWYDTQAPIDPGGTEDEDYPVRIHARRAAGIYCLGTNDVSAGILVNNAALASPLQPRTWSTRSVRIKGGLGDRQGLFLSVHVANFSDTEALELSGQTFGTLYYRARM